MEKPTPNPNPTPLSWEVKLHKNSFCNRQTEESRFSHFSGSDKDLLEAVAICWPRRQEGSRAGVIKVAIPPHAGVDPKTGRSTGIFFSGVVQLEEGDIISGCFEARTKGEKPRKTVSVEAESSSWRPKKVRAQSVEIILYSSELLSESGDNERPPDPGSYEIISINASPTLEATPITPQTLLHNHFLHGAEWGTTATDMSDSEFVAALRESFLFWRDKTMVGVR